LPYRYVVRKSEVLLRLSDHIRACYERAEDAERCAMAEPENRTFHLEMAKRWALLARSYEFAESLERFLLDLETSGMKKRHQQKHEAVWQPIATAPFDRDLRLAVIDQQGEAHALVFPCRRILGGWLKAETKAHIDVDPTHWREWSETN
jgi:hypothetical protein